MKLINIMKSFTTTTPPEDVDLLVCDTPESPTEREFEMARFYRKGAILKHDYCSPAFNNLELVLDSLEHEPSAWELAPETGFYIHVYCPKENRMKWHLSNINPLDSWYVIINPLDDPE